jgi:uncharacterized protein DUF5329
MVKTRLFLIFFAWLLILIGIPGAAVIAQSAPIPEKEKIEALIKQVGDLKDAKFIRNGWTFGVSTAVRFLRGKWEANDANVKTARDFIDKVASVSGTSGKPYLIRFNDGREMKSRDFLLAELEKLDPHP